MRSFGAATRRSSTAQDLRRAALSSRASRAIGDEGALLDAVWPEVMVGDSMPAICVTELRKALDDEAKIPRYIETVHGRGYRFVAGNKGCP